MQILNDSMAKKMEFYPVLEERLKGIVSRGFLKGLKIKSVLSVHAPVVFEFFAALLRRN
jgi:hypothetical protein